MNYKRIYDHLMDKGRARKKQKYVHERHHIIPRCLGGSDDSSNITILTLKEHFIAHRLLVYLTEGLARQKMLTSLSYFQGKKGLTARQYETARLCFIKAMTGPSNPNYGKRKELHHLYGRKGKDHPRFGFKHSEESRKKISLKNKDRSRNWCGGKHPMLGRKQTEKAKQKMKGPRKHTRGSNAYNARPVIEIISKQVYASISKASEALNVSSQHIWMVCQGKCKHAKGYIFEYQNKELGPV